MANTKISNLTGAASVTDNSVFPVVDSGSTKKVTGTQIKTYARSGLSTVAVSGSYNDLTNKPTLFNGAYASLTGKPTLFDGNYNSLTNKPIISDTNGLTGGTFFIAKDSTTIQLGQWAAQAITIGSSGIQIAGTGGVEIAGVAGAGITLGGETSGTITFDSATTGINYNDLSNKPSITSIPDQDGHTSQFLKTDGSNLYWDNAGLSYNDLNDLPTIPTLPTSANGYLHSTIEGVLSWDTPTISTLTDGTITDSQIFWSGGANSSLVDEPDFSRVSLITDQNGDSNGYIFGFGYDGILRVPGQIYDVNGNPVINREAQFEYKEFSDFDAEFNKRYIVRTQNNPVTVTLPSTALAGGEAIFFADAYNTFSVENPLIITGGYIGDSNSDTFVMDTPGSYIGVFYTGNGRWRVYAQGPLTGGGSGDSLVAGDKSVVLGTDGTLTLPYGATVVPSTNSVDIKAGAGGYAELINHGNDNAIWVDDAGAYVVTNGNNEWTFGYDNYLKFPATGSTAGIKSASGTQKVHFTNTGVQIDADSTHAYTFGLNGTITMTSGTVGPTQAGQFGFGANTGTNAVIKANGGFSTWIFKSDNTLQLPAGGDIVDSNGTSVLGGSGGASTGSITFVDNSILGTGDVVIGFDIVASPAVNFSFTTSGVFTAPRVSVGTNTVMNSTALVQCLPNVDTVVYTATDILASTIKALFHVEGVEDGTQNYEAQSCEMMIATIANKVSGSVYGLSYTSNSPLATLTARLNSQTNKVEITCRPSSSTESVRVSTSATEMFTTP